MDSEVCMNGLCGASLSATGDYKNGWALRSGGFANLCDKCGIAYEQLAFCELFHLDDTGWRECTSCGKRLHCGCIASSAFLQLLDNGGVTCVTCSNSLGRNPKTKEEKSQETIIPIDNHVNTTNFNKTTLKKPNEENGTTSTSTLNGKDESALAMRFNKYGSFIQQGTWSRHIFPKSIVPQGFNANFGTSSQIRVARPPVEGRVKNQLLPRYWPRITEQELQQISGDSNATIVPLFEKILSASDAGRIGRLVLPKACAEAYFPPISQPEGLPLRIQDVKGKEWLFQFRFWPNNNSRMYVLEGVTPCIQSMQLQAGDTVTFSRMEPEGKLLMGFRKASPTTSVQLLSRNVNLPNGDVGWHTNEQKLTCGGSFPVEKKRSRNIGSKSKRFLIESEDALELKHTWEESQDMLFAGPLLKPSIVTVEGYDFEEYEGPPVFGKGSIFTICSTGEQEQWGQCDNCSKWRRSPADFILPPRWTCQDNAWDPSRAACLAPDELGPLELDNLLTLAKDFYRRRNSTSHKPEQEQGYNIINTQTPSIATGTEPLAAMTTKHPRHRPGCSCIVCIQPPSGKGKHDPSCTCNVCMTVKRRFKTLMLRKKIRQSEHESNTKVNESNTKVNESSTEVNESSTEVNESSLDLNVNPVRDEDGKRSVSMMSLLQVANMPLETYLKKNGLTSLIIEQKTSSSSQVLPRETGEIDGGDREDDDCPSPVIQDDIMGDDDTGL